MPRNGVQSSWVLSAWLVLSLMRIQPCFPALTVCPWEVSVLAQGCVWAPYPCLSAGLRPVTGPLFPLRHEPPPLWPTQSIRLAPNLPVNQLLSRRCFLQTMTKLQVPEVCLNPNFTGSSTLWNSYLSYETGSSKECTVSVLLFTTEHTHIQHFKIALPRSSKNCQLPPEQFHFNINHQWDSKRMKKKRNKFFVNFKKLVYTQIRIYLALMKTRIFV